MKKASALEWKNNQLVLVDQRYLPSKEEYVYCDNLEEAFNAIRVMVVRGAPLIGFSAIYGLALWVKNHLNGTIEEFAKACEYLKTARPTAVNLSFESDRVFKMASEHLENGGNFQSFFDVVVKFGHGEIEQIEKDNLAMAKFALSDLDKKIGKEKYNVMTLCNTGYLACGPMGTALGVISYLNSENRLERAYPSETRPYLQGSRLTSYEMMCEKIPHDIVVEGASSYILGKGLVDAIFIGADRIVANGDAANKVGSSSLSIVAKEYGIPFYVVAPTSSFDLSLSSGSEIEIELRDQDEILYCGGQRIAPDGATALNPSFDVSRAKFIEGIICEKGLIDPVTIENVERVCKG